MTSLLRRPVSRLWLLPVVLLPFAFALFVFRSFLPAVAGAVAMEAHFAANRARTHLPIAPWNRAIVRDAMRRYERQNIGYPHPAMSGRVAVVVGYDAPPRRCVEMQFLEPSIGGVPVYCYEADADVLVSIDNGGE